MIKFTNLSQQIPYLNFKQKYDDAFNSKQSNTEAICISSYSSLLNEVNSRFVNLKLVDHDEFIFFSNYNSPKSVEFLNNKKIAASLYWNTTNTQIRIKATIKKTSQDYNNAYFMNRSEHKNALAISSNQSKSIDSYESVIKNYTKSLKLDNLKECPEYWGGYSFTPYYFEFWEGHDSRLNKRDVYERTYNEWNHYILQP